MWSYGITVKNEAVQLDQAHCTVSFNYLQTTWCLSCQKNIRIAGRRSLRRNKTSQFDDETFHSSSRELMITCRSSGLLHLHTNRPLEKASSWQAPVFSALSSSRSTKESLEVFYLSLGGARSLPQKREFNQLSWLYSAYEPCITGKALNVF